MFEENEKENIQKRKDEVQAALQKCRDKDPNLTRAEILHLQRTFELQYDVKDRLNRRNELQAAQTAKQNELRDHAEALENSLARIENAMTTPRSKARRCLLRKLHISMCRQAESYVVCQWGCGDWVRTGQEQQEHLKNICRRRVIPCSLGCKVKLTEEDWLRPWKPEEGSTVSNEESSVVSSQNSVQDASRKAENEESSGKQNSVSLGSPTSRSSRRNSFSTTSTPSPRRRNNRAKPTQVSVQEYHEQHECVRRLIPCPRRCLEWSAFEDMPHHMDVQCVKRPSIPQYCRLGCGAKFGGLQGLLLDAEEELMTHEQEECPYRQVRCTWKFEDGTRCVAQIKAKDRDHHRDLHITALGIITYVVAGTYTYRVPEGVTRLKVQLWGAGGGSGLFYDRGGGAGGGGAFVEAIINVEPLDVLEIVVGAGGGAGVRGHAVDPVFEERAGAGGNATREVVVVDAAHGTALGGVPGGGDGYGTGEKWASGGGGGYSMLARKSASGNQALLVAGGGGGGGTLDGLPGCGMNGPLPGTRIDKRNGGSGCVDRGGELGDSGNIYFSAWPAASGTLWLGGHGCQFGGGGGGGYQGGGGGGTTPGVGGAGGGGCSFVYTAIAIDYVVIEGKGRMPGGLSHDIPHAVGVGEWDKLDGFAGEGGDKSSVETKPGMSGAARILKAGFF